MKPLKTVRALVVDGAVLERRAASDLLNADSEIEVVGTAATGSIALQKIAQLAPNVILLDATIESPNAGEVIRAIRASWQSLPIVVAYGPGGAAEALQALRFGANDCAPKQDAGIPSKLRNLVRGRASLSPAVRLQERMSSYGPPSSAEVTAIAIGASTGGPNALAQVFASLPADVPVPIFIVQHMPPVFTRKLAESLSASSGFDVVEGAHGMVVEPGRAYVAPGDHHMAVVRDPLLVGTVRIALDQDPPENSCRPAVDVLFRSVASVYGTGTLAAVLTGMGYDGTRGARQIAEAGGTVIVQDAATCVVPTMPSSVAGAIRVDGVYPIDAIAGELMVRVRRRQQRSGRPSFPAARVS